jgi:hypothetical protein
MNKLLKLLRNLDTRKIFRTEYTHDEQIWYAVSISICILILSYLNVY